MRIRMLRGVGYQGRSLDPGETYDIDAVWAQRFIAQGRAVAVVDPPDAAPDVVQTGDPDPVVRDPSPRRSRGPRAR